MSHKRRVSLVVTLLGLVLPTLVLAQNRPDAGVILREIESSSLPRPPEAKPRLEIPGSDEAPGAETPVKVFVRAFRLKGVTLLPEAELLAQLKDMVNRELSLAQLQLAAVRIGEYYRQKGLIARAFLPRQVIEDGVVEIVVNEARLGGVEIAAPRPERADADVARRMLLARQPLGEPARPGEILHALRVINETPGFSATAIAQPGKKEGETSLLIKVEDTPFLTGVAMLDNHGSKATGVERTILSINANNPSGAGDQISVMGLATAGNHYYRLGYAMPLGYEGWRAQASLTSLRYVLGGDLSNLNASGWARLLGLGLTYPLVRAPEVGATLSATFDQKLFVNDANQSNTSHKVLHSLTLGLAGDWRDGLEGLCHGNVSLVHGTLSLGGNADNLAADRTNARTHGDFAKLHWTLSRTQKISERNDLFLSLSGQRAGNNLDSGEKFSLGGPAGVRAFPVSEASGDEGWLLNAEWRHHLNESLQLAAFVDTGGIHQHKRVWNGWDGGLPGQPNRYRLGGSGFSFTWKERGEFIMTASLTRKKGNNAGADAQGRDGDGTRSEERLWWQFTKLF